MATARFGITVVGAVGTVAGVGIGIGIALALALNVGVVVAVRVGVGGAVAVAVVVAVGIAAKERPEMIHDEWRHRAHAADDLLTDIAAVCRGEMPAEAREGGSEAHRAAWAAVCALRVDAEQLLAACEEARRMLAECAILTGTDTDGNTLESGWVHLWRRAVDDVRQLRADYDDHSDIERAERERDEARAEVSLLQQEARIRRHISDGLAAEVAAERAAVVAWLRYEADAWHMPTWQLADKIERGAHRREETK